MGKGTGILWDIANSYESCYKIIGALDDFSISLHNKLYKNKVGFIRIFLAISPKWPFEISKIAKFTAKLFILLKANFKINEIKN